MENVREAAVKNENKYLNFGFKKKIHIKNISSSKYIKFLNCKNYIFFIIMNSYVIAILSSCIMLLNIVILDVVNVKMCQSFSIYRVFTINSTVCTNISTAIGILEKMFTSSIIGICTVLFQSLINKRQIEAPINRLQIKYHVNNLEI